ncbi:ATP-binding cassette sub-family A member 3 [Caerostris extrusa]|uniref:ATP-binding cassette sub-family A member 3 n=1 Tax=Caerostris extrusa TaxID=172846 RepID=A0AAV4QE86_CAEEX|nr:ATP-binding cassette sub-family A member 3 [Caerostris extrusa]
MNDAKEMFEKNINNRGKINLEGLDSEKKFETYGFDRLKDVRDQLIIGTVFNNFKGLNELPASLDYTIRYDGSFSFDFNTRYKYRANGPNEETGMDAKIPLSKHRNIRSTLILIDNSVITWAICYGYLVFILNLVRRIIEEKVNGSKVTVFAVIVLLVLYILSLTLLTTEFFTLDFKAAYYSLSLAKKLGICLIPQGGLLTAFYIAGFYETTGEGAQWTNISEYSIVPDLNILMVIETMLFSCLLYSISIWYFDAVWPWQPGVPRPFYFLFTRSYWCGSKSDNMEEIELVKTENNSDFFEEEPMGTSPGVIIKNLSKEFHAGISTKLAVNNVSLNIYQGQITAILGHNGAGKTTIINILTGLYTPTNGGASINGLDILKQTTKARQSLGLCPQHNVLYDTLTVEEHLKIYAAVLFLDEPTTGMDAEARRNTWDALLEMRHDRTIILTTHYMEEADILGDRIAIMAEGEVQCCGSPMFLKQKFGTGYHLHVVKDQNFDLQCLTNLLQKYIPEVKLGNQVEREISFNLLSDADGGFGDMFEELENRKSTLGVTSFGVTITTMEDVFLNVSNISDLKYKLQSHLDQQNEMNIEIEDICLDSPGMQPNPKFRNQFLALLIKRFHYTKTTLEHSRRSVSDSFSSYAIVFLCHSNKKPELSELAETFKRVLETNKVSVTKVSEPTHHVLNYGNKHISMYLKNLIIGAAIDQKSSGHEINLTAWFNGEPYHALPMSLLLVHTAVLRNITNTGSISLTNAPLPRLRIMSLMGGNTEFIFICKILGPVFLYHWHCLSCLPAMYCYPYMKRLQKAKLFATYDWDTSSHVLDCNVRLGLLRSCRCQCFACNTFCHLHSLCFWNTFRGYRSAILVNPSSENAKSVSFRTARRLPETVRLIRWDDDALGPDGILSVPRCHHLFLSLLFLLETVPGCCPALRSSICKGSKSPSEIMQENRIRWVPEEESIDRKNDSHSAGFCGEALLTESDENIQKLLCCQPFFVFWTSTRRSASTLE